MLKAKALTAYKAFAPLSIFSFISNQGKCFNMINEILRHKETNSPSGYELLVTGNTSGSASNLVGVNASVWLHVYWHT